MPRLLLCVPALFAAVCAASAAEVTIVFDFDGPHSERSIEQMKREAGDILKEAGLRLEWRESGEAARGSYENLVVVHFKGKCMLEPVPMLYDERGPYAFTYNSDGAVLPYSEVECGHVTASVQTAMAGDDFGRPDFLMGRALGRVVAHELVHILTRSGVHGRDGVAQPAFSGRELIGAPLRLSREDVERLRRIR
ncbi:MAG TPA: hypothetical protein VKX45_23780 [Bryobacteraceae bacterium]|jgi:hypothetical protein|nr:hypothetical protein [Bryobacteraceae bacterium]